MENERSPQFPEPTAGYSDNPCRETLKEKDSILFCNLSESSSGNVQCAHNKESYVELLKRVANGHNLNKGFLNVNYEDNNALFSEGGYKFNQNDEIHIEETSEKGNMVHSQKPNSPEKIEASSSGIKLVVEVFGLSNENDEVNNVVKNKEGCAFGEQDCKFEINDLVWAKTRTQVWWPGMISDPSNAAKDSTNSESFLVKYFGSANSIWCSPSDLKPFIEYLDQFSGQMVTCNFRGSLEKALGEIGKRVKSSMTCPCFSKESQTLHEDEKSMSKDVLSVSQFEPANFLTCIKDLACVVSPPGKIESIVIKNRLSAFYTSIGHSQMPMQLLRPSDDADPTQNDDRILSRRRKNKRVQSDGEINSSGKDYDSRERKKSKYLSYPYVEENPNLGSSSNLEQQKAVDTENLEKIGPLVDSSSKSSRKKGSRNSLKGRHVVSKADDVDASSSDLLAELRSMAIGFVSPSKSKYSDSLERFYSSMRVFTFSDDEVAHEVASGKNCFRRNSDEAIEGKGSVKPRKGRKKKEEVISAGLEPNGDFPQTDTKNDSFVISFKQNDFSNVPKSEKTPKKRKRTGEIPAPSLPDLSGKDPFLGTNTAKNDSSVISFEQNGSNVPKIEKTRKRRKRVGENPGPRLPDLSGKNPIFSVENLPVERHVVPQDTPVPDKGKEALVSPNVNGGVFDKMIAFASGPVSKDSKSTPQRNLPLNHETMASPVINSIQIGSLPSYGNKSEPKKRKIKEKTFQGSSPIPDLNGNATGFTSTLPQENKKTRQRKRRIRSVESGPKGGDLGAIIFLNFAKEFPLPSKETLIATFSRFGLVKESEIQFLDDSIVQIGYERYSDAQFAFRSLEKIKLFGDSLVSFKFHLKVADPVAVKDDNNTLISQPVVPVDAIEKGSNPLAGKADQNAPASLPFVLPVAVQDYNNTPMPKPFLPVDTIMKATDPMAGKVDKNAPVSQPFVSLVAVKDYNNTPVLKPVSPVDTIKKGTNPTAVKDYKSTPIPQPILHASTINNGTDTVVVKDYRNTPMPPGLFLPVDDPVAVKDYKNTPIVKPLLPVDTIKNGIADPLAVKDFKSTHNPKPFLSVDTINKGANSMSAKDYKNNPIPQPVMRVDTINKGEARDLTFIKKNVEMMQMTLEKAGNSLSPEMRAKLENEIKRFLDKIRSMDAGSSSS